MEGHLKVKYIANANEQNWWICGIVALAVKIAPAPRQLVNCCRYLVRMHQRIICTTVVAVSVYLILQSTSGLVTLNSCCTFDSINLS